MDAEPYTRQPRPTLWLIRGGPIDESLADGRAELPSFYLSKSPVTNREFEAFDPTHARALASPGDDTPVTDVSYADAERYCAWYSQASGKSFRLPTGLEWEYACRAGTQTRYFWGNDLAGAEPFVWDAENSENSCHPIESKRANRFGLHDMLGHVWEWAAPDEPRPHPLDADNPGIPSRDSTRAIRGGSFRTSRIQLEVSARQTVSATAVRDDIGFRILRRL